MNRLPCCDRTTRRSELAACASLGLAGVMMVALAVVQMTKFVAGADQIAAAVQSPQAALAGAAREIKAVVTNTVESPAQRAAVPAVIPGKV